MYEYVMLIFDKRSNSNIAVQLETMKQGEQLKALIERSRDPFIEKIEIFPMKNLLPTDLFAWRAEYDVKFRHIDIKRAWTPMPSDFNIQHDYKGIPSLEQISLTVNAETYREAEDEIYSRIEEYRRAEREKRAAAKSAGCSESETAESI